MREDKWVYWVYLFLVVGLPFLQWIFRKIGEAREGGGEAGTGRAPNPAERRPSGERPVEDNSLDDEELEWVEAGSPVREAPPFAEEGPRWMDDPVYEVPAYTNPAGEISPPPVVEPAPVVRPAPVIPVVAPARERRGAEPVAPASRLTYAERLVRQSDASVPRVASRPRPARRGASIPILQPPTPEELRRIVAWREILAPPLAERRTPWHEPGSGRDG